MLIEKRNAPEPGDIVTVKLASGEEVIGRLAEKIGDTVSLTKPLQIIVQPISATQMGMGFRPLLGSVSENATIQCPIASLALRPMQTSEEVARNYIQATTGLVTADHMPSLIGMQ